MNEFIVNSMLSCEEKKKWKQ